MPSVALIRQLKKYEGLGKVVGQRTYIYRCTSKALTVGWGHNLDAHPLTEPQKQRTGWNGSSITLDGAEWLFAHDVQVVENEVDRVFPWTAKLAPARRDVVINMAFQMGITRLKKFRTTLGLIRAGQYRMAALAMRATKWARQTPKRARELAEQMRTGSYA